MTRTPLRKLVKARDRKAPVFCVGDRVRLSAVPTSRGEVVAIPTSSAFAGTVLVTLNGSSQWVPVHDLEPDRRKR